MNSKKKCQNAKLNQQEGKNRTFYLEKREKKKEKKKN